MNDNNRYLLVNVGTGLAIYERVAVFDGNSLSQLQATIEQLIGSQAIDNRESHISEEDNLSTSLDPSDSPQEDE